MSYYSFLCGRLRRLQALELERGQTLVEYALIAVLLAVVAFGILAVLGQDVTNLFTGVEFERTDQTP